MASQYTVTSQWAGFWAGRGWQERIDEHLEMMAAYGWRLVDVKRLFLWFPSPLLPRQKFTFFWALESSE